MSGGIVDRGPVIRRSLISLVVLAAVLGAAWYIAGRDSGAIELTNDDFLYGTYIIDQPGTYVLAEDISFNPNSIETMDAAIANGEIAPIIVERAGWENGVDAFSAGNPFPTQFGDYQGTFTPGGIADVRYNPAAYGIGFFAAIAIEADDVTLDLNGYTIEQSAEHSLLQRFFAVIELADQPFIPAQGPHSFGESLQAATNVTIENGTIGRSAHHGIHGNENVNVTIRNVDFVDYEVGAVALNGVDGLLVENVTATNRKDVPVVGTFSSAQFIKNYVLDLVRNDSQTTLEVNGEMLDAEMILDQLRTAINAVHEDVIIDNYSMSGYSQIDPNQHPDEYALFHNPHGVIDGNSYSFLVNNVGVAVNGFPAQADQEADALARNVVFRNVHVIDQQSSINETVALETDIAPDGAHGNAAIDPIGALFQVRNVHPDTGVPVTVSSLDPGGSRYTGNPVANAQAFVAKAAANGEFDDSSLDISRSNLSGDILAWVEGLEGSETLSDIDASFLCNGDSMFHVNKGAIAFKMDAVQGVTLENTSVSGLVNLGATGSMDCGNYAGGFSHPAATLDSYGGNAVRGYTFAGASDVVIADASITGLMSATGQATGIAFLTDASTASVSGVMIDGVEAGLTGPTGGPDIDPHAMGLYIGETVTGITVTETCVRGLQGANGTVEAHDESGSANITFACS